MVTSDDELDLFVIICFFRLLMVRLRHIAPISLLAILIKRRCEVDEATIRKSVDEY
jgi:hypothetical protein